MTWDIRRGTSESIGASVLPGVSLTRGSLAGRRGIAPRAGSLSFVLDANRVRRGDQVQLLDDNSVEWTGRVRNVAQVIDRGFAEYLRWQVSATGPIADLVAVESGSSTALYTNIALHTALGHFFDAIGWSSARRDIGASSRTLLFWQLLPQDVPWEIVLSLLRTAGPRGRLYENKSGQLVFRDVALAARSRTFYGRTVGTGARAFLTRMEGENEGLDRVINDAVVPYARIPSVPTVELDTPQWAAQDLSEDNAKVLSQDVLIPDNEIAVGFAGWGAFIDGAGDIGAPVAPQWSALSTGQWDRTHGSTAPGSATLTVSTAVSSIGSTHEGNNSTVRTSDTPNARRFFLSAIPDEIRSTQGGGGAGSFNLPVGATNIQVLITSITRRTAGTVGGNTNFYLGTAQDTPPVSDAGSLFTWVRNGGIITVTPTSRIGTTVTRDTRARRNVFQYDVAFRVTWIVGSTARTWAALHIGTPTGKLESATTVDAGDGLTVRTAANLVWVAVSGADPPRLVEAGDLVAGATLLLSACVIEGRLNAAVDVDEPVGWDLLAGSPSLSGGMDANNSRRILFVASRTLASGGAVPAVSWTATGPADVVTHSAIIALAARRDIVWKDPIETRPVDGTVTIDITNDAPLVNLVTPIAGVDFVVLSGTVTSVSVTTAGIAGVQARLTLTGSNAMISMLQLRGQVVIGGELAQERNASSIATYGRSGSQETYAPYLSESVANSLADDIVNNAVHPRRSWDVVLDADRDAQTGAAALGVDIGDRVRTYIDSDFDHDGEVLGLRHVIRDPAGLLQTTVTMLGAQLTTSPPSLATVPGRPNAPTLAALSTTEIRATVTPPGDGGSRITRYDWQWRTSGAWNNNVTTSVTSLVIDGLSPNTRYEVRVRAANTIGAGAYSLSSAETTQQFPAAAAPSIVLPHIDAGIGAQELLAASISGGRYDTLSYNWTVSGGRLSRSTAAFPVWTTPSTPGSWTYRVTITARGTGVLARSGTMQQRSATGTATTSTIIRRGSGTAIIAHATLPDARGRPIRRGYGTPLLVEATIGDATARAVVRAGEGTPLIAEAKISDARATVARRGDGTALVAHASLADATGRNGAKRRDGTAIIAHAILLDAVATVVRVGIGTAVVVELSLSDATGENVDVPVGALTIDDTPVKLSNRFLVVEEDSDG